MYPNILLLVNYRRAHIVKQPNQQISRLELVIHQYITYTFVTLIMSCWVTHRFWNTERILSQTLSTQGGREGLFSFVVGECSKCRMQSADKCAECRGANCSKQWRPPCRNSLLTSLKTPLEASLKRQLFMCGFSFSFLNQSVPILWWWSALKTMHPPAK